MNKVLLNLLLFAFLSIQVSLVIAQAPNAIPYQGVARNASGDVLSTQAIALRISLHDLTASGTIVYQETHNTITTSLGLFNLNIGSGTTSIGTLTSVNWGSGAKFIQVEMDAAGGSAYVDMGTSQLNSVPYALFAGKSADLPTGTSIGNTMRWDGTSWVSDNSLFNNGTNVGIGTTSPAAKLDVAGTVKITDGSQGAGKILKSDAIGNASWGSLDELSMFSTQVTNDLSCPALISSFGTPDAPFTLALSGNFAFVGGQNNNSLQIINISNPSSPTIVGSINNGDNINSISVNGNFVYIVSNFSSSLKVYDVSNPSAPVIVSSLSNQFGIIKVIAIGTYAYVLSNTGLTVLHIVNPTAPVVLGYIGFSNFLADGFTAPSDFAFITGHTPTSSAMKIVNFTNHTNPFLVSSLLFPTTTLTSAYSFVTLKGNYVYINHFQDGQIYVVNISNISNPVLAGTVNTNTGPTGLSISGNYMYVLNSISNTLQTFDISNPALPVLVNTHSSFDYPFEVITNGRLLYYTSLNSGNLSIVNLSCSQNFVPSFNPSTGQTTAMELQWETNGNNINNTNTGNVGIGNNTPSSKMDIVGTGGLKVSSTNIGSGSTDWISGNFGGVNGGRVVMGLLFGVPSIGGHNSTLSSWTNLTLNVGGGNVGIGTSSPTALLSVNGTANKPGGGSWATFSDRRLKSGIIPFSDGLNKVLKIQPVKFHYNKAAGCDTSKEYVGVIAQDLKEVVPFMVEKVSLNDTEYFAVDNSAMTYMLINAVKEQQAQIETLKAENEKLKAENTVMKIDNASFKTDIQQIKAQLGMGIKAAK